MYQRFTQRPISLFYSDRTLLSLCIHVTWHSSSFTPAHIWSRRRPSWPSWAPRSWWGGPWRARTSWGASERGRWCPQLGPGAQGANYKWGYRSFWKYCTLRMVRWKIVTRRYSLCWNCHFYFIIFLRNRGYPWMSQSHYLLTRWFAGNQKKKSFQ